MWVSRLCAPLLLAGSFAAAQGLYSWKDDDGVTHFSDRPPSQVEAETARPFVPPGPNYQYPIWSPGMGKTLRVSMANNWAVVSSDSSEAGKTVRIIAIDDPDNFRLLISAIRVVDKTGLGEFTKEQFYGSLPKDIKGDLPDGAASVRNLAVRGFTGYYVHATDSRFLGRDPPPEEYRYTRTGRLYNDEVVVVFTALDNEPGERLDQVLDLIGQMRWLETSFNRNLHAFEGLAEDHAARVRFLERIVAGGDDETVFLFSELVDHRYPADAELFGEWTVLAAAQGYRPALIKLATETAGLPPSRHTSIPEPDDESRYPVIIRQDGFLALTPRLASALATAQRGDVFELEVSILSKSSRAQVDMLGRYHVFCSVVERDHFEQDDILLTMGKMLADREGYSTRAFGLCSVIKPLVPGAPKSWAGLLDLGELPFRIEKSRLAGSNFWYLVMKQDVIVFYL